MVCLPLEKESSLQGKNLLPLGANSYLVETTPFKIEIGMLERNRKSQISSLLQTRAETLSSLLSHLNCRE